MDMSTQGLINSGMAWRLEGAVGRACMAAIESGDAILGREGHRDYYGNYVPSRYEVEPGTKGSLGYANRMRANDDMDMLTEYDFDNPCPECGGPSDSGAGHDCEV
jgi:hypothetical protein